jgi:hypothetical protein
MNHQGRHHGLVDALDLLAALGSPVGGGARSSFAGAPSSSVKRGFKASAQTW